MPHMTEPDEPNEAVFAMGCFWGAEKLFWQLVGVLDTEVGYTGGSFDEPGYRDVCTGRTGHAEAVRVVFDPQIITYRDLLAVFWENHDPTQGMRQGNDIGSQYRSAIFTESDEQAREARESAREFGERLQQAGFGPITTEITPLGKFWPAEEYHQRYLEKNPNGYCPVHATGVTCG
jgi:peptide-methionine (S)-S-oxide reductase